jgi:small basic protein
MWWLIPAIGLLLGAYFGQFLHIEIPAEMVKYLSIGIMAALDSVFGGIRALYEKKFDAVLMLSGFFTNALLAAALAYIGDMLSIDLYYAAVFAFGVRLFSNLSLIRVYIIGNLRDREKAYRAHHLADNKDGAQEAAPVGEAAPDGTAAPVAGAAPTGEAAHGGIAAPMREAASGSTAAPGSVAAPGSIAASGSVAAPGSIAASGSVAAPGGTTASGSVAASGGTTAPSSVAASGGTTAPSSVAAPGGTTAPSSVAASGSDPTPDGREEQK